MAGAGGLNALGMIVGALSKGVASPVLGHFGKDSFSTSNPSQRYGHNGLTLASDITNNLGGLLMGASAPGMSKAIAQQHAPSGASPAQKAAMYHDNLMNIRQMLSELSRSS